MRLATARPLKLSHSLKISTTADVKYIEATLEKDTTRGSNEALIETYRRLRPGDLATVDNARQIYRAYVL